jgi:hypothetical protein
MTLLPDALDRTLKEPQCARRWHVLMAAWESSRDTEERALVIDTLKSLPGKDARTDVLRLSFLARASGDSRYENEAAARTLAVEPEDPDRLAAFMAFRWLSALQDIEGRSGFIGALSAGLVPEMAARLMQSATRVIPSGFAPRVPDGIRRVALVVPHIGHQFHTPSMMAVEQCVVLAHEGLQVRIFSAQELTPPDAALFRGDGRDLKLPPLNAQAWGNPPARRRRHDRQRQPLRPPGALAQPDAGAGRAFDPDVVLLVGLYSPLAAALHTLRPVVGISVNTVPPIAPLDIWLTADTDLTQRHVWGGRFPPPIPVYHPWRVKRSVKQWQVTRTALGLDETTVVWVTAGFRLEHEIKGDWANRMLQLMSRYPQVAWLLVGGEPKLPDALRQAAPGRVRALGTRDDVPGIFRCADIFVNPPRMGGGFSVAEAMAEGLPVTSLSGSDGGDKVGELALPDIDRYMERLAALTENPALRTETGQAMRKRFAERFDLDASGPALLAAFRQAAALARERLTGPS